MLLVEIPNSTLPFFSDYGMQKSSAPDADFFVVLLLLYILDYDVPYSLQIPALCFLFVLDKFPSISLYVLSHPPLLLGTSPTYDG